jgi:hypothetical protein
MRDDFCAFILTHGRPDRVHTVPVLRAAGYTGPIRYLVDDEDATLPEYQRRFKDEVIVFSKAQIAETFDEGNNFGDRRSITFARNAAFGIAKDEGFKYFIQLDDDYTAFFHRFDESRKYGAWRITNMDAVFTAMLEFFEASPFLSVAMSQAADHIGGGNSSYICSTDRPFQFVGLMNEDVNTYTSLQRRGGPFLTFYAVELRQIATQSNPGGITDLYRDMGTYVKSFHTVMYAPSCALVASMRGNHNETVAAARIHHRVKWESCAPLIIPERYKKHD